MPKINIGFLLILFLVFGCKPNSTEKGIEGSERAELIVIAKDIMTNASSCSLISLDEEGRARSRMMDAFAPEEDLTVWFGTNPKSRKVRQIKNDDRVTIHYIANDGAGYVMINGIAEIINDPKEKQERWKEGWEGFYTNRTDAYALIKVVPERMEVVTYTHNILGDTITWKPPVVLF